MGAILIDPLDTNRIFLATLESSVWSIQRSTVKVNYQTVPNEFSLSPNYPNPFNSSTTIRYTIPSAGPVMLSIYDILGRKVRSLLDIQQPAGEYQVTWEADRFGSGVYFARLTSGSQSKNIILTLLK